MYKFWCDYVKPKYGEKAKLSHGYWQFPCMYIKTNGVSKDTAKDVETRFGTSNFELNRPLLKGKNKKCIGVMKDKLLGKKWKNFLD